MRWRKKPYKTPKKGEGFCLLPWRENFRDGYMVEWSDASIAVLPVIAAHANKNGEAWPSYARIGAFAKVSKTTVAKALDELIDLGLISKTKKQGDNTYNEYTLCFAVNNDNKLQYMPIHHRLIFSGAWGAMRPSERRVYLIFRALARGGFTAIRFGYSLSAEEWENAGVYVRDAYEEFHPSEFDFLAERKYAPSKFAKLAGVKQRTFRDSVCRLIDKGLLYPYASTDDESITGLIIPFFTLEDFDNVLKAVEKAKQDTSAYRAKSGARRSFAAMLQRATLANSTSVARKNFAKK